MKTLFQKTSSGLKRHFERGHWILRLAGVIGLLGAGASEAQQVSFPLPFYEPFPTAASASGLPFNGFAYANNEELGQPVSEAIGNGYASCSSNVWSFGNSISSSCGRIFGTNGVSGLEYPGLTNVDATYQTGLFSMFTGDASSTKNRGAALIIPANNTNAPMSLYASCLINLQTTVNAASLEPYPFFGLIAGGNTSSVSQNGAVIYLNPSFQLQLSKNTNVPSANVTSALVSSNTYLLVLRYQYNPGANDQVDIWVNPIALGTNAVPAPTMTITNNPNLASNYFGGVGIFEGGNPPKIFIDEIRVATNWAGVTPTFPAPGNIYSVTGGGTGGVFCGNTGFNVGLSGSDTGVAYYLYANGIEVTNANGPIEVNGTGSSISFGAQTNSAIYTVVGSNTTTFNQGWMSGSATLSLLSSLVLTTQPVPVAAPSGALAAFSVGSTGGGQIYQWYKGGVALTNTGEFSGVQSSNLVIFPVAAKDAATTAAGYYVVISNACGTVVTSTTNALTVGAAHNLVWVGDGNSNYWDVAVSTNWATSSGAPPTTVFNFGDNVVFDDTSANTTVTLNNNTLSPSTLTINGGANAYILSGSGSLAGPGSIVMNSTASVTLSAPNAETGGIVISNGILNFSRPNYLGFGPITLAGGELASPNIGAVSITNQITVTGTNSAIGVNSTGGQNLTVTSPLSGTNGSLTFINNSTKVSTPLTILTAPTFTFNLPVDINVGTIGGGMIVAAENTSGVQTWNGVISDTGQFEVNGTGGTTVLNNSSNTFSGGVLLDTGNLGVGSSNIFVSPATTPPTILSGPLGTGTLTIGTGAGSPALFASGAPQTVGNTVTFAAAVVGPALTINGTQNLTLAGTFDLRGTNRTLTISNTATILSGIIVDSTDDAVPSPAGALTKAGPGTLYLDGVMYNGLLDPAFLTIVYGAITNSAGTLAGSGTLASPVTVLSGATIGAGDAGQIGTLTISNNLTLQGSASLRLSKTAGGVKTSDLIAGISNVVYGGTLVVTNIGAGALAVGDSFTLFNAAASSGNFTSITGAKANFTFNANTGVLTVASLIPTTPTNITFSVTSGKLNLSWPANYTGWTLQTNAANILNPTNWFPYPGSAIVTSESITITNTGDVYFRLVSP